VETEQGWMLRNKVRPNRYIKGNAASINYVEFNKAKIFTKAEYAYKLKKKLDKKKEDANHHYEYYDVEVVYVEMKIMTENDIVEKELLEV
jgi:hypothetical protein